MPSVFTGTPIIVEPNEPFFWTPDVDGFYGQFSHEGAGYLIGFPQDDDGACVAKTTDGGLTWSRYYQSNPDFRTNGQGVLDSANDRIVFIGVSFAVGGDPRLHTASFDLIGLTWSAVTIAPSFGDQGVEGDPLIGIRPNGDIRVLYTHRIDSAERHLEIVGLSGSTWGTPIGLVVDSDLNRPRAIMCGSDGIFHIAYQNVNSGELRYITLQADDSVGSVGTIATDDTNGSGYLMGNGIVWEDRDTLVFLEVFHDGGPGTERFHYGSPISSPVWTAQDLNTPPVDCRDEEGACVLVGDEIHFFFSRTNFQSAPDTVAQIIRTRWDGTTVFTEEIYWDIVSDPPPGGGNPSFQFTDGITVDYVGGAVNVTVNLNIDTHGNMTSVFLRGAGTGSALEITTDPTLPDVETDEVVEIPIEGTTDEGCEPIAWSLDGSYPSYLSIDPSTGILTITPDSTPQENVDFTVRATDGCGGDVTKDFHLSFVQNPRTRNEFYMEPR